MNQNKCFCQIDLLKGYALNVKLKINMVIHVKSVGRLTAHGLAERFRDGGLRWAIGGRNLVKLEHVRAGLGSGAAHIPIITGDSHDVAFLETLVARTNVVCSTVGP